MTECDYFLDCLVTPARHSAGRSGIRDRLPSLDGSGELEPVLEEAYGEGNGRKWYVNWRLFYLACAELFGMNGGEEWIVSHYLFDKR